MREIVTIQVGEFANYIGSHFWNFQDELLGLISDPNSDPIYKNTNINMDVLYRTGLTHQGVSTYCPRVISIGSQGSLGTLSSSGSLYENISKSDKPDILTWKGGVTKSKQKPHDKNLFLQSLSEESSSNSNLKFEDKEIVQNLEKDVKFWSDFSKVHFHPKSLYEINSNWTDLQNFDNFGVGNEIVSNGSQLEEINERLRFFIEECDHIQGIQFIVDNSGGFSGVSSAFLENISDDYANIPVLLYSAKNPNSDNKVTNQRELISKYLHDAVSLEKLSNFCNLIVPIGVPSLSHLSPSINIKDDNLFYTSSIYASAIHSISLPFRFGPCDGNFASGSLDIGEIIHVLSSTQRQNKVAALDLSMPVLSLNGNEKNILSKFCTLTPELGDDSEDLYAAESLTFNGALYSGKDRASISQINNFINSNYETLTLNKPKSSHLSISLSPLPIPLPFPSIFSPNIGLLGQTLISPQTLIQTLSSPQTLNTQNLVSPQTLNPPQQTLNAPQTLISDQTLKGSLEVESVPIATRVRSSVAIKPYIETRSNNIFKYGINRGAKGSAILKDWGFDKEEVQEMGEHLKKMLRVFDNEFSDNDSDSD